MERLFFVASGVSGAFAVLLGAFGAHGLRAYLATVADGVDRRAWWETAAHYHLVHALVLAVAAYLVGRAGGTGPAVLAGFLTIAGTCLFSGSLYVMTLTGLRALGAVTPIGGLCFVGAWVCLALAAWRLP